ncbi:MAG: ATP phosphoribosyltransferase [Pseudomonadota bacterium]
MPNTPQSTRLRIAIQKSGRMSERSWQLLEQCGLRFTKSRDTLFCRCSNFPVDLLLVRDDDIPGLIGDGACELAVSSKNVFLEKKRTLEQAGKTLNADIRLKLGFSACRLAIALPATAPFSSLKDLNGLRIATSYPALLHNFAKTNDLRINIVEMAGALEVAPRLEIADAICDIVQTGNTLIANGLREVKTLLTSQAILLQQTRPLDQARSQLIERLIARIEGARQASESRYVMLHCPVKALPAVSRALPGQETPTIVPLHDQDDKVAVHALCREDIFWETMEALKQAGASSILVLPIEKMFA